MNDAVAGADQERYFTAIHEASHAVTRLFLGTEFRTVSVVAEPGTSGRVIARTTAVDQPLRFHRVSGWSPEVRQRLHDEIICDLAGDVAEQIAREQAGAYVSGYVTASTDHESAMRHARLASDSEDEALQLVGWLKKRTESIVQKPIFRELLDALATELLKKGDMSEIEVEEFLRPIADELFKPPPLSWRRRASLRVYRMTLPLRRAVRRLRRRWQWRRSSA